MALSAVKLCNFALDEIGAGAIESLTEASEEARKCNLHYEQALKAALRSHAWQFATKDATLAELEDDTPLEYNYTYALPTDFLRALHLVNTSDVKDHDTPFRIASNTLETDESPCYLRYVAVVSDPNEFDELFVEAFTYHLAARLARTLTQDRQMSQEMAGYARAAAARARAIDATETIEEPGSGRDILDSRN